ncbi:RNA polymerase sporulation sigma factor SigK [Anaeropeptidivorans aminofermentans]|jgi:RNA polymerase sporulation-specific sigma factor|uniref:RNA polymerase sporulation sigma factor SigK n=1 Tax=Anaeropeptidivorans aminofermentans TaxID=2934315 RepID=UPI002023FEED|nr:RNA polymerase sporulation sigma factor SigK [Anaeropeptidivorans aminofermentans]
MLFYIIPAFFLCSYISGGNSFPEILSPEDEEKYLNDFANGDIEARNKLIEHNLRLVAHIVKKYSQNSKETVGDLISVGTIGLIKGVNTYKPNKKTKLATYAAKCIENEILMNIRSTKKHANDLYLQDTIGVDSDGNEVKIEDKLADENYSIEEMVELGLKIGILYDKIKSVLKGRERIVLELRYGLVNGVEMTQREIADMLCISRSYVSRIEKKALKRLCKEIKD